MSDLAAIVKQLKKDFGESTVQAGSDEYIDAERLPTGVFPFDLASGGGFPLGKVSIVYGPECLWFDTFIQYEIKTKDGKRQNHKGGTIEKLWHRFHGLPMPGKGHYQRASTVGSVFTVPSINEAGAIFHNRIENVIKCGVKACYELKVVGGETIKATAGHKFWNGVAYVKLEDLSVGDVVHMHRRVPFKGRKPVVVRPKVKATHHPKSHKGYISRAKLVCEAEMNGLSPSSYQARLCNGATEGLAFVQQGYHIHHRDGNPLNDVIGNLEAVHGPSHNKKHAFLNQDKLRYISVPDVIESITPIGEEMTYDLRMAVPHHNYVADGFVVHNSSGKTNIVLKAVGEGQKMFPSKTAVFIDAEHAFDPKWATQMGVNVDELIVVHPEYAEQAVDMIDAFLYASDVFCVVLDSIAALSTQNEIESSAEKASVGGASLIIGKLFKKATVSFNRMRNKGLAPPAFIGVNQIRHKIGVMYGDPETMPGGNAIKFASSFTVRTYGKNKIDKKIHPVLPAFKETSIIIKKWKMPVNAVTAVYFMQMVAGGGHSPGHVEDWPTMKAYLSEFGYLGKTDDGKKWILFGEEFPTMTAARQFLYADPDRLREAQRELIKECLEAGGVGNSMVGDS